MTNLVILVGRIARDPERRSGMPSNFNAAAEMASDFVGNASAELIETPFAKVTFA